MSDRDDRDAPVSNGPGWPLVDGTAADGGGEGPVLPDRDGELRSRLEAVAGFSPWAVVAGPEPWDRRASDFRHVDDEAAGWTDGFLDVDRYERGEGAAAVPAEGAPWTWICQLVVTRGDGVRELATGWLVSPRVVVTAGRVVFHPDCRWAAEIEVLPGYDGWLAPGRRAVSRAFQSARGWVEDLAPECDYGAILLPEDALAPLGHFGLIRAGDEQLERQLLNSGGYPADQPRETLWYEGWRVRRLRSRAIDLGDRPAAPSGSPLWMTCTRDGRLQRLVCGLVPSGGRPGHALRFDERVFGTIARWARPPSPPPSPPGQ